jgi:tRNA dimethylallyltransferase
LRDASPYFILHSMTTHYHRFIIILFGPTGVGKTDVANKIAQQIPVEIINLDMGQLYIPLNIGTAKPDWQSSQIPHHLFDVINEPRDCSVIAYRNMVIPLVNAIWSRGNIPLLVGGSGFYLRSLLFSQSAAVGKQEDFENVPESELWDHLYRVDPERAAHINKLDIYRIKRALNIWQQTGQKPSKFIPHYEPIAPFFLLCLTRDRDELYARIDQRVLAMMHAGWLAEVEQLLDTLWQDFLRKKHIIGYDNLIEYLGSEKRPEQLSQTIEQIKQRTRHYAKRQMTYWRLLQRELHPYLHQQENKLPQLTAIDLTSTDIDLYINKLLIRLYSLDDGLLNE